MAYIEFKKNLENWPILEQNHELTPLEKFQFFGFFFLVFIGKKVFYSVLEYHKTHFHGLYCLEKKVGKMASFRPKPRTNHVGKMSIFRLL